MTQDASYYVYTPDLEDAAADVLRLAIARSRRIVTAESCTGGALAALLTDVEGLSHAYERGYIVYCDEAKVECLGVSPELLGNEGAVSRVASEAMAEGALARSGADVAIAITGNAGPAGPHAEEGLVYVTVSTRTGASRTIEHHFGASGRPTIRIRALETALDVLRWGLAQ